jgi:hypothetical protein
MALFPQFVREGMLMSYGPNFAEGYRRAGFFIDTILKGTNPRRPAHRTNHQIRAGHQPEDREDPRSDDPTFTSSPGR